MMGVLFQFDAAPGGEIAGYECVAVMLPEAVPVACDVWYDARWPRQSQYYAEAPMPVEGQAIMACIRAVDYSGNRSECVGDSGSPVTGGHGTRYHE